MTGSPAMTPLDAWTRDKIGLETGQRLTRADLDRYCTNRLRQVFDYARQNSPFYRDFLCELPEGFPNRLGDLPAAPFTTEADLRAGHQDMLCVSRGEVARVVTLPTLGDELPKRLYFTDDDLELTVAFFHHGMSTLIRPGARVLILMPGRTPDSIGDLLKRSLARMDAEGFVHGQVMDPDAAIDDLLEFQADCLVGLPYQVLTLARHNRGRDIPVGMIKSVLLSADYIPGTIVDELEDIWGVRAFEHYGMTEMGLGGGVQCEVRQGYHLREADLFFEVVDPVSGRVLPDGEPGEVVFTTLTRRAMPLIRYRTGDMARMRSELCSCGSVIRRLGKVVGRISGAVRLQAGGGLNLPELDEALFRVPGLLNFKAELHNRDGRDTLSVQVYAARDLWPQVLAGAEAGLAAIPAVAEAVQQGRLLLEPVSGSQADWPTDGATKRMLVDCRFDRRRFDRD